MNNCAYVTLAINTKMSISLDPSMIGRREGGADESPRPIWVHYEQLWTTRTSCALPHMHVMVRVGRWVDDDWTGRGRGWCVNVVFIEHKDVKINTKPLEITSLHNACLINSSTNVQHTHNTPSLVTMHTLNITIFDSVSWKHLLVSSCILHGTIVDSMPYHQNGRSHQHLDTNRYKITPHLLA